MGVPIDPLVWSPYQICDRKLVRKNGVQCGDATYIYIPISAILIRAVAREHGLKTKNEAGVIYLPPTPEQVPESQTSPNCF